MLGQHGGAVEGKEGFQSWPGSEEHLTTPPIGGASEQDSQQAHPSLGHQCPKAQEDSEKVKGQSLQLKISTAGVALAWPGKHRIVSKGKGRPPAVFGSVARVKVRGREGPTIQVPLPSTHLLATA